MKVTRSQQSYRIFSIKRRGRLFQARPCVPGVYLLSELFTISSGKGKIMERPKELLQKCWRDPRIEKTALFTMLEKRLA